MALSQQPGCPKFLQHPWRIRSLVRVLETIKNSLRPNGIGLRKLANAENLVF